MTAAHCTLFATWLKVNLQLLERRLGSICCPRAPTTAVLTKAVLDTISLSVKQSRHRLKNRLANWMKRKRRQQRTVQMTSWGTHSPAVSGPHRSTST
ncbi:hypothetical protein Bpfe_000083 [Biomphalaria pfeifferi]|uniref:Uncharacterized protein n=1 Tax=Biomphalaria pfeifferi TaxID=112525 RepID=A0AAD8FMW2_BIOPF|nr:hypothetical protein Bpfe_000083 [Biomphalaria pfeifferi]